MKKLIILVLCSIFCSCPTYNNRIEHCSDLRRQRNNVVSDHYYYGKDFFPLINHFDSLIHACGCDTLTY